MTQSGEIKAHIIIQNHILEQVRAGELAAGNQLPSERALAKQFQTSRTSVREALRTLEAIGIVETRLGSGTYVTDKASSTDIESMATDLGSQSSPFEVIEARLCIEPFLTKLAAVRGTESEIEYLLQCIEEATVKKGTTLETIMNFEYWDGEFHLTIAKMAKNQPLLTLATSLHSVRTEKLWGSMKQMSLTVEGRMDHYASQHSSIYQAIKDHRPAVAAQFAQEHLKVIQHNLLEIPD
ncbi:FadR/GntR family transcriptional regulator [Alicyclobacillus fastidiosus]|uniref:Pyruvate dehydrogenase complex repressor n=1 Tax=Alicyclobacillus fastidiosus TaxID=392011 RepID=A0ABV5AAL7_9BACL|nr:FadR/GntR family transcriptional regulator [Alicyclobacillus fastidiosus]WEH11917.1 FadR/GntR family transcriptional regulator [Alicyclobacillus fastidiosus]